MTVHFPEALFDSSDYYADERYMRRCFESCAVAAAIVQFLTGVALLERVGPGLTSDGRSDGYRRCLGCHSHFFTDTCPWC